MDNDNNYHHHHKEHKVAEEEEKEYMKSFHSLSCSFHSVKSSNSIHSMISPTTPDTHYINQFVSLYNDSHSKHNSTDNDGGGVIVEDGDDGDDGTNDISHHSGISYHSSHSSQKIKIRSRKNSTQSNYSIHSNRSSNHSYISDDDDDDEDEDDSNNDNNNGVCCMNGDGGGGGGGGGGDDEFFILDIDDNTTPRQKTHQNRHYINTIMSSISNSKPLDNTQLQHVKENPEIQYKLILLYEKIKK